MMENKRLYITIIISVVLVSILFISNTYSIFTSENADPNSNVYTTGNLDITYEIENGDVKFTDSNPISSDDVSNITPYRIKIINSGNVSYKFNVILEDTTATEVINYKYIMVKVGKYDAIALSDTHDNIIREGVVVKANSSVIVDVKVYISDKISNSEVGKNFSAKLSINGVAIATSSDVDNSKLMSNYQLLIDVKSGSYVYFSDSMINKDNANYVSVDDMGYCYNISNKYRFNGWRVLFVRDNIPYVISAGAHSCYDNDSDTSLIDYINGRASNYCDAKYIYGGKCSKENVYGFSTSEYNYLVNNKIEDCDGNNNLNCGYNNDIINNGGYYWILDGNNSLVQYYWNPSKGNVFNTSRFDSGYGIRVVLRLNNSIFIKSGDGSYNNPYVLANNY